MANPPPGDWSKSPWTAQQPTPYPGPPNLQTTGPIPPPSHFFTFP